MKNSIPHFARTSIVAAILCASLPAFAQTAVTTTSTTTSAGTISEFSPTVMMIKTETAPEPVRYTYTKSTTYVDESGNPVSIETVKSGAPVTVYYSKDGDNMVATKVIVRKAVSTTTTAVPAPVEGTSVEKKTSTTTTTDK